jgi:hypothetical protein
MPCEGDLDALATDVVEAVDVTCRPFKIAVLVWFPEADGAADLYTNASATQLEPVLRAMGVRLESGSLRMPTLGGQVRWVDVGEV